MSRTAKAPLQKITMNLYLADYELFKEHYGTGWQEVLRSVLEQHAQQIRKERQ